MRGLINPIRHLRVKDGLPHPLLITSSSLSGSGPYSQLFPYIHQGESSPQGGSFACRKGSCRAHSPLSALLQPSFCSLEGKGLVEASDRPFASELLHHPNATQDGDQPVGPPCGTEGRLDGLHRFEGCLPSGFSAS